MDEDGYDELFEFEQRVLPYFEGDASTSEYRLECTQAHQEFEALVEKKLQAFLARNGWSTDEFHRRMKEELATIDSMEKEHEHAEELVRMIYDAFDFDSWAHSMRYSANHRGASSRK
ncbi:unnamed protein product [Aphanomyces euteiches]